MIGITREQWPAFRAAGMDRYVAARLRRHLVTLPGTLLAAGLILAGLDAGTWRVATAARALRSGGFWLVLGCTAVVIGVVIAFGAMLEYRWLDRLWGGDDPAA